LTYKDAPHAYSATLSSWRVLSLWSLKKNVIFRKKRLIGGVDKRGITLSVPSLPVVLIYHRRMLPETVAVSNDLQECLWFKPLGHAVQIHRFRFLKLALARRVL
ncbi:unnamed protein product, partial [Pylaiella littoralis]